MYLQQRQWWWWTYVPTCTCSNCMWWRRSCSLATTAILFHFTSCSALPPDASQLICCTIFYVSMWNPSSRKSPFELFPGCTLKLESGTPPCAALILNFYPVVHENLEVHNVQQFPIWVLVHFLPQLMPRAGLLAVSTFHSAFCSLTKCYVFLAWPQ